MLDHPNNHSRSSEPRFLMWKRDRFPGKLIVTAPKITALLAIRYSGR